MFGNKARRASKEVGTAHSAERGRPENALTAKPLPDHYRKPTSYEELYTAKSLPLDSSTRAFTAAPWYSLPDVRFTPETRDPSKW